MSSAVVLAALAGITAAAAVVDALTAPNVHSTGDIAGEMNVRPKRARLAETLARLGRRAGLPLSSPSDLQARIDAAGIDTSAAEISAIKAGAAISGGLLALPLTLSAPGRLGIALALAGPAAGYVAPDAWLARRARRRAATLTLEVADVLDLLRVAIAAGLPPTRALAEVGRRRGGLLGAELAATAARISVGVPRAEAYARLSARCPLPAITAVARALERADRQGAPLAPLLQALALDARTQRARALQERAAKAAPKIQLVVALLLVPAALLIVAAALLDRVA